MLEGIVAKILDSSSTKKETDRPPMETFLAPNSFCPLISTSVLSAGRSMVPGTTDSTTEGRAVGSGKAVGEGEGVAVVRSAGVGVGVGVGVGRTVAEGLIIF